MAKIKSDCTIIIPTFNRPYYLERILNYYSEYGKKYKVIVADSSFDENKGKNKKIIESFKNLNILYLSDYPSEIIPMQKWCDAVNHVESKYCVFCADDDFVTLNGISQSMDFLEKNPDFICAQGKFIEFKLNTNKTGNKEFYWEVNCSCKSVEDSDMRNRLNSFFSSSDPYSIYVWFYGVYRNDFLNFAIRETVKFTTNSVLFDEFFLIRFLPIYGKLKNLDVLYGIREIHPIPEGDRMWIPQFMEDKTYEKRYTKMRLGLATHISKNSELDIEKSKELIDDLFPIVIKGLNFHRFVLKMKKTIPAWIYKGISVLYKKLVSYRNRDQQLRCREYNSKYYKDISKIGDYILNYNSKLL